MGGRGGGREGEREGGEVGRRGGGGKEGKRQKEEFKVQSVPVPTVHVYASAGPWSAGIILVMSRQLSTPPQSSRQLGTCAATQTRLTKLLLHSAP